MSREEEIRVKKGDIIQVQVNNGEWKDAKVGTESLKNRARQSNQEV